MLFALLKQYLRPYRGALLGVLSLQLVQTMASLILPTLNADIIDRGVAVGDTGYILRMGAWMLLVSFIQVAAAVSVIAFAAHAAQSMGRDLRSAVYQKVGAFSKKEMTGLGVASLITRSTNDVQQIQMLVMMGSTLLVMAPILVIGGVIMAVTQDLSLSWLIAVSAPLLIVILLLIIRKLAPLFRLMQKRLDRVNQVLREQLTGIRVVRAFVRERDEVERFAQANAEITETALQVGRWNALTGPVIMMVLNISSVAVLWFGSYRVEDGQIEVGTLMAFLQYLMQILMAIMMATFMVMMIPRAAVSADRVGEVLGTDPSVVEKPQPLISDDSPASSTTPSSGGSPSGSGAANSQHARGIVTFDNVSFQHPGAEAPVLRNLTFDVAPGTTTAIIGSTGSGKTTMTCLIPRLFDVTEGRILVDGVDVRDFSLDALRNRLGYVPQKPFLFAGTIASNMRFGKPDATDEEIWHALEVAQARDFVEALPERLAAPIAQGGTNVSGGQRQRLAIARALLPQPEMLIFDDSFSALDTATDARLRAALAREFSGTTRIVVAQRIASVTDADQIIVLEHGAIVAKGTHEELLVTSPTYAEIASSQAPMKERA